MGMGGEGARDNIPRIYKQRPATILREGRGEWRGTGNGEGWEWEWGMGMDAGNGEWEWGWGGTRDRWDREGKGWKKREMNEKTHETQKKSG